MNTHKVFDEYKKVFEKEIALLGTMKTDFAISKQDFIELSERYPDLQMEREKNGKLIINPPAKFKSGNREAIVIGYLGIWWLKEKKGRTLSPSTGIDLPDGSTKSPDCGWVSDEKLANISAEEQEGKYLSVVPEFVVEVRSVTDRLPKLKKKMTDSWMKNGVQLAWLVDPYQEKVYIYRQGLEVEILEGFSGKKLSGEDVMPGMECPLDDLKKAE